MDTLIQDLRFGIRMLRRSPGFTTAAVLALAVGIGATVSVFTVLDAVVLRPLAYPDADRLVMVWETNDNKALPHERLSPVNFMDYRALSHVFDDAAGWWYPQVNLTEAGRDPMRLNAVEASGNFFKVIGVPPALGNGFPSDRFDAPDHLVVISHRLWRGRFGSDRSIIGKPITLSDAPYVVAGVMPPGFDFPNGTDVWQQLQWDFRQHSRSAHFVESIFRLKRETSIAAANAELRALTARLASEHASTNVGWSARATPLAIEIEGYFRPALFALFGAASFLLLITCTNVASLLLARATAREREVAVRAAIGASRPRLVRQFLTESVVLAAFGCLLGIGASAALVTTLAAAPDVHLPRFEGLSLDWRMTGFPIAVAVVTALAFGVVPAMFMAGGDVQRSLKESGRGVEGGGGRARRVLVSAEVALAVMLLVGAALLGRSFQRLVQQDTGFRPAQTVTANVELPFNYTDFRKIADWYDQLLTNIRSQSGIRAAGMANFLPLTPGWRIAFLVDGRSRPLLPSGWPADVDAPQAQHQSVDEDYFKVIGVPLVRGRFFDRRDNADAPAVVVINEALARREWPAGDAIGQRIITPVRVIGPMGRMLMPPNTRFEVVGIVGDVKNTSLAERPEPAIYFSFRQFSFRGFNLVVSGDAGPAALLGTIRSSVQQLDANLPLSNTRMLERVVGDATDRPRALMLLMAIFATIAVGLAALGVYSVLAYTVNQRRRELSVRMALGAQPRDLVKLVLAQGATLTIAGSLVGVAAAFVLGRTLSTLLFGVSPADATAFATAVAVAFLAALSACLIPARRAASLDPIEGLRAD
jgi:putative ABC transport system permease protein